MIVLFIVYEWERRVLEVLREPLESGHIVISRAARQAEFPARFQLISAMNPCPCGWYGDPSGRCHCSAEQVARYRGRISGPLLDRIDLVVEVPRLQAQELRADGRRSESSSEVAQRVLAARQQQLSRGELNAHLSQGLLNTHCRLNPDSQTLLDHAIDRLQLSARASQRILRVARTIADLQGDPNITQTALAEAISFRRMA